MDLSAYSDEELMALAGGKTPAFDPYSFAEQEAAAAGLPPGLVSRVVRQESGGRLDAVSPKGARGPMQLMPNTARELGVNIDDPEDNIRGGVRYLKQQFDTFGTPELALAAYNAGPEAVRRHGGIPPYAETQNYVASIQGGDMSSQSLDLTAFTDDELAKIAGVSAPPRRVGGNASGGVTLDVSPAAPLRRKIPASAPRKAAPAANPTIAQDAWSGFAEPFKALGRDVAQSYRKSLSPKMPSSPLDAARELGSDLADTTRIIGDVLGLAGAPLQAIVRPTARAINRTGVPLYGKQSFGDAIAGKAPVRLDDTGRQAAIESTINTALSAAKPAAPRPTSAPRPQAQSVEALRAAKTAAYQAVDDMGVAYSPQAAARLADDIGYDLATKRINPRVTPKAHALMEDIQTTLKSGNPVTMTELDQLRQAVSMATGKGDDAEQFFGMAINGHIDDFVDKAGPAQVVNGDGEVAAQALRAAREMNKRYRKTQTVTNEVASADLRSASTYAGGNKANAIRQELRPLIDPTSNKRIRNLSPRETKALKRVVEGSGGANAWRSVGKVLDPRGLLGAVALGPVGLPTAGIAPAVGAISSEMSNRSTMKAVRELLKILSVDETVKQAPKIPILTLAGRPGPSLASAAGITGAAEVAAPLARLPSERPSQAGARRGKDKRPQKR